MKELLSNNPYFSLIRGEQIKKSDLDLLPPTTKPVITSLVSSIEVIGQYTLDNDLLLWMPSRRKLRLNL